ncbi:uncharacterized protein LOC110186817 isoform X2 [Drosophila serrata]|uniref:uncharacterized protein LOC110186817 isoform X2 n=1 Tax=Drosophila serrata TaxID=7274 RepID=UPI000A1D2B58|nr:uncharacterized protein LOC110186817 isoform X2 [Drosophila serrata]
MHLKSFLFCIPLKWGTVIMVIDAKYDKDLIWFFRKMSIKTCVAVGSLIFYIMGCFNVMLAYGAYNGNHRMVGIWLLVHFSVFMLTIYSALVHTYFLLHVVAMGYSMFVVRSFYETLAPASGNELEGEDSSEEDV